MFDRVLASGARTVGSAVLIVALADGVAPAQASTSSSSVDLVQVDATTSMDGTDATPDFTCASRTFCLFHGPNETGYHFSFTTDVYNGKWLSVTAAPFDFNLPWGSLHNNSNSTAFFYYAQKNKEYCLRPGSIGNPPDSGNAADLGSARYIFIKYGITTCDYPAVPS
jgi:hypothetical protein